MVNKSSPACHICNLQPFKYKCPACTIRYCSVACFKAHKSGSCTATNDGPTVPQVTDGENDTFRPLDLEPTPHNPPIQVDNPLKSLTSLSWPPEPDPSVFSDPLKRDDPKPLRQEELLRIATSPALRHLLTTTSLPSILLILDSLPTPQSRHTSLSRILGLDPDSLSKPTTSLNPLLNSRDSPPPLEDLVRALTKTEEKEEVGRGNWGEEGWWLGRGDSKAGRVWIGLEERRVMRVWAGVVCQAIDGEGGEGAWGKGELTWEV